MIVQPAPALAPEQAARRAAAGHDPVWLSSPGAARGGISDVAVAFDAVAADPSRVVRGDSLDELERAWAGARAAWTRVGLAPASEVPLAVGWLSYDLARAWLPLEGRARAGGDWSPLEFRFFDAVWIRDVRGGQARIFACDEAAATRLLSRLNRAPDPQPAPRLGTLVAADGGADPRAAHAAAVGRIREYLLAGDAYQVNLARRLIASIGPGDPLWMAATLRARAPAPHAVWLGGRSGEPPGGRLAEPRQAIDRCVVGNSPERFLRVEVDGAVETRPIKGTRPRGGDPPSDETARAALAAAPKDRAEHVMIVDLERNDLGRVCQAGTVVVEDLLRIVQLPTLFHLVSTVRGRLRAGVGLAELLRATFPGGSVTGAPKRRAMQIVEELEPVRRGIYTGATGWLGAAGDLDLAIAIRTALVADGVVSLSVGGGIVVDSDAAAEWEETEVKARAFLALCQGAGR